MATRGNGKNGQHSSLLMICLHLPSSIWSNDVYVNVYMINELMKYCPISV